jgi:predicted transcriptional regulator
MTFPIPNLAYTRTYRFGMDHIAKLSFLAGALKKDQSEIVREAIDEYYERHADVDSDPTAPVETYQAD